jgi:hypothetical protein
MRILFLLLAVMTLGACGVTESFSEMQRQTAQASDALLKEIGSRPQIGWSIDNGALTKVDVIFQDDKVAQMSISELSVRVRSALASNLKEKPQQVVLSVILKQ